MSEIIGQDNHESVNLNPTTKQKEDYKSFFLRRSTWEAIKISRGWVGRGSVSRFAEAIGITRQYASDLINGNVGCSSNVMRKVIDLLGINGGCWCHLFDKYNLRDIDPNHPIFNQMKYQGEMPYNHYSISAETRKKDYPTETLK